MSSRWSTARSSEAARPTRTSSSTSSTSTIRPRRRRRGSSPIPSWRRRRSPADLSGSLAEPLLLVHRLVRYLDQGVDGLVLVGDGPGDPDHGLAPGGTGAG